MAEACGEDLMALRRKADLAGVVQPLGKSAHLVGKVEVTSLMAANVGGVLPGRGSLADEVLVLGAHLDHLGMGNFSSRDKANAGKKLHPGADDNASGVTAVMMIADRLVKDYAAMPADQPLRTIVFLALDAEESGLNGANYYVNNPLPGHKIEQHALMCNFDMIGRITNKRLSISGTGSAEGLDVWAEPYFERSPLDIVSQKGVTPNSDHYSFYRMDVPVLFGIIADFHDDYHTPRDVSAKLNRVDAVNTIYLFHATHGAVPLHQGGNRATIGVAPGLDPDRFRRPRADHARHDQGLVRHQARLRRYGRGRLHRGRHCGETCCGSRSAGGRSNDQVEGNS